MARTRNQSFANPEWSVRWLFLLWIYTCYLLQEAVFATRSTSPFRQRGRGKVYDRQLTVGGSARDCTKPQVVPSRTPSREGMYTCCEGWKLDKNACTPDPECFTHTLGKDYQGFANKTTGGRSCVSWSSPALIPYLNDSMSVGPAIRHTLNTGGRNCRNPWLDRQRPWCFVELRPGVISWEYCDVGKPRKSCNIARNYRVKCGSLTCNQGQVCLGSGNTCGCPPGYYGARCESQCEEGWYGEDCRQRCECSGHEVCHHVIGTCNSSEDESDADEVINPLDPSDRLPPGNGTAMCRSSCGVLAKIGCTCRPDGGACRCPSYVIALFVVSITTWITLGGVCVVCTIRRRRYRSKIEYKRDSDYCEELESDDDTELGISQPTTVTTASEINTSQLPTTPLNESLGLQPLPPLPPTSPPSNFLSSSSPKPPDASAHHVRFAGSSSPNLRSDPSKDPPVPEPADSRSLESSCSDDSHVYLNVDREESVYSIDYSHPYEYLTQDENGMPCVGEDPLEMSPECILLQYMVQQHMRALNNAPHGYVNDSVAKWQDRKISKRLFPFGQTPFPINGNTPTAVVVGTAAARGRQETREILQAALRRGKPTIKPKPDVLKLLANGKKGGPHQRLLEKSDSLDSECEHSPVHGCINQNNNPNSRIDSNSNSTTTPCQQLRPIIQKRAATVPSPSKVKELNEEGVEMTMFPFSDDHIYENSKIVKPCHRFAKSRSTDLFSPL
ncbi:uncharacterized protein [Diadema antillarum]|uniref:uncharacterized protein n=1 Tax=Diadema antillarum TaxID=105358 RepID=UPI003A892620